LGNEPSATQGSAQEKSKIKVLLAEDRPGGSPFWEQILAEVPDAEIEFSLVEKFADDAKHFEVRTPDVIILDLSLPAGGGLEAFLSVYNTAPNIPIIVVTGTDNQKLAVQAALAGAQDCLVKSDISGFLLSRSIRYAIGRQNHLKQLKAVSVIDELTGLYNRRGFLILADQRIKMSERTGESLFLVFADVDGLKAINDTLGHHGGDLALMESAHVLREAFRETDILGRLGGDEFVALLADGGGVSQGSLRERFQGTVQEHNAYRTRSFKLSISIGISLFDPRTPCSIGDLLDKADKEMYVQKKAGKVR
jgi:diguanylate cyclase (GGDEF)-like protein